MIFEICYQAEEDGESEGEDGFVLTDRVFDEGLAEVAADYVDEIFAR